MKAIKTEYKPTNVRRTAHERQIGQFNSEGVVVERTFYGCKKYPHMTASNPRSQDTALTPEPLSSNFFEISITIGFILATELISV